VVLLLKAESMRPRRIVVGFNDFRHCLNPSLLDDTGETAPSGLPIAGTMAGTDVRFAFSESLSCEPPNSPDRHNIANDISPENHQIGGE
jgi:hypothetical protein